MRGIVFVRRETFVMQRLLAPAWMIAALLAFSSGGVAAQESPSAVPDSGAVCAIPNAPARTLDAVAPITPTAAKDISGQVAAIVSLDAASRVTSAIISKSPSPLLNNAALAVVRQSAFQTRIVECRPVADRYLFLVDFAGAGAFVAPAAMTDYFAGKWECRSDEHPRIVEDFHTGSEGATLVDISAIFNGSRAVESRAQSYGLRAGTIGVTEQSGAQTFRALSRGWNGDALVFLGKSWNEDSGITVAERMTYTRLGKSEFTRTIETATTAGGPWARSTREHCARSS